MNLFVDPTSVIRYAHTAQALQKNEERMIEWMKANHISYEFGKIIHQEFVAKTFSVNYITADIATPASIDFINEQSLVILTCNLEGKFSFETADGQLYELKEKTMALQPITSGNGMIHIQKGLYKNLFIILNEDFLTELSESLMSFGIIDHHTFPKKTVVINQEVGEIIKKIISTPKRNGALVIELKSLILALANLYNYQIENSGADTAFPNLLHKEKILAIRDEIVNQPHIHTSSVKYLSKNYLIDRKTMSKTFRLLFNIQLSDFIHEQIMRKANELLLQTDLPIKDIGDQLGYSSNSNFTRAFTEHFGKSPFDIRKGRLL
jgi:AraC-like DNA-binding protein